MSRVAISSEIGPLKVVICHTPGPELAVVTPANRRDYLFDDLLDLELSRREHARFVEILSRFASVYEISRLLRDVLEIPEGRQYLLAHAGEEIRARSEGASAEEVARLFVEGEESEAGVLAEIVNESGYSLPPLPNLFFSRDAAAVINRHVLVGSMKHEVRWSEEVLAHALFRFHPALANDGILFDGAHERRLNVCLEGGDVHVLRRDLLLVGMSERTTAAGIEVLTTELFRVGEVRDVLVVLMPAHRAAIHLDMIFTQIDRELCCVYPPYFLGPTRLPILHMTRAASGARQMPDLFAALRDVSMPLQPVFCGGKRRTVQEREQWGSACNFFAVAPGQILAYGRNEHTLRSLEDSGFAVLDGAGVVTGDVEPAGRAPCAITFEGSELVRGGGGPRCMTLPILREDV